MQLCEALAKLRDTLPPVFAGTYLDQATGEGYRWRSLQNEKSRGDAPVEMFIKCGNRKTLLDRDKFLTHWQKKIDGSE